MVFLQVSCLLFMCTLTSTALRANGSDFSKLKNTQDIFLSFKSTGEFDPPNFEEIFDERHELQPNIVYYVHVDPIPDWVQFIILQTHAYLHNVSLGYNIEKVPNKYVIGQNIGLVQNVSATASAQFFLENDNPFNVSVLLAVVAYSKKAPVPGGCNMEFEVETAPWLRVNLTGATVVINSQPARAPQGWGEGSSCDLTLHYRAYHLYLPEKNFFPDTYFEFIRKMIGAKRIMENGREVGNSIGHEMRQVYSAYHGTGSVYAVVVSPNNALYAAYVPALTYNCNPAHYTDSCQVLTSVFSRLLCAVVLFLGLFLCLFGHSFFQTEVFLMSTLVGAIIAYALIAPLGLTDATNIVLATVGGVTIGNCWLIFWWATGSPLLSLIVATLNLAFFWTSVFFYIPAIGDLPSMENNVNYWLAFICFMLLVAVVCGPQTNRVNILACSIVGSYAAIVPIDHYVGANLKYVFINTMRRATVKGFNEAIIDPPFQTKDVLLATIWAALALFGYFLQCQRFGNRPPFPRSTHPWETPSASRTPLLSEERPLLYAEKVTGSPGSDDVFT